MTTWGRTFATKAGYGASPTLCGTGSRTARPVLVVDDDALFRKLGAAIPARAGYRPVEAANGRMVKKRSKQPNDKAVILDVRLPGISGCEVCHQVGARGNRAPVLFASRARIESFDGVARLLVGGDDYLVKLFGPDELLARLHASTRRARKAVPGELTSDKQDVVQLLREGLGAGAIADRLGETEPAARDRVDNVFRKLGV